MKNISLNKILWLITTAITLVVAVAGVVNPNIYVKVMDPGLLPAGMAQDILTVIVSVCLLLLISQTRAQDTKKQIIILGILGSFGYLYAIFAIERIYNLFYLGYLAIVGLTLYTIPFSIASLDHKTKWKVPNTLRIISISFSSFIAILFTFIWTSSLIPAMMTGKKIELFYSIYILDLAWVMPGFFVTAVLTTMRKTIGLLLTPAMYILGIFVIFPLGLGELAKPFYGMEINAGSMVMSFGLAGTFVLLAMLILKQLNIDTRVDIHL